MTSPTKVYCDGGCRPNPGAVETAVVIGGQAHLRLDHGQGDNNDAEWLAMIDALTMAQQAGLRDVILLSDSAGVVAMAKGEAPRIPARFAPYVARFQALATQFTRLRIRHVRRGQNLAGIALERLHGKI